MSDTQKSYRRVCFTLNNYTDEDVKHFEELPCKFIQFGKEVGEKGTPHLQGYIEFKHSVLFETLKNICKRAHWEKARGSELHNYAYTGKDGNPFRKGIAGKQGERTDLNIIKDDILKGKRVDDIALEKPIIFHQYGRTLNKIEDLAMRNKFRSSMTKGIWIWGETGVGKSHMAFKDYTPQTHYVLPNDNGWWDAYTQQPTVIINDFRGEIPYNQLLQLVDKYPYSVKRRNREPMPFVSDTVIITSSLPPEKVYNKRESEDKIAQLLRRFDIIHLQEVDTSSI